MKESTLRLLKESEEKYRHLFDTAPFAILLTDLKGKIFDINKAGEALFTKYKRTEIIGKSVLFLLNIFDKPENYLVRLKQRIKILLNGETPPPVEYFIKREDSSSIWIKVTNSLVQINKKTYILNIIKDITKQKEIEIKLKESEEKFRLIVENFKDAITILGFDGKLKYISPQFSTLLGLKEIKSPFKFVRLIHSDDFDYLMEFYTDAMKKRNITMEKEIKFRALHSEGHYIWLSCLSKNYYNEKGEVIGFISLLRDITEQKKVDQILKNSEEKYRLISENANDLISIFNHKFKYEYINEKPHLEVLGYIKEDLIGKSPVKMIHPDDFNAIFESFQGDTHLGTRTQAYRVRHKNGFWVWLEFRGRIINDKKTGKKRYLLISRDVTTQQIALNELKKKKELLRKFIEESYDGVVLINERGIVTHWNRGQEDIFGLKKKEVIGRPVWDIMFQVVPDNKKTVDMYSQTKKTILNSIKTGKGDWLNKLSELEFQDVYGNRKFVQQLPFPIPVAGGYIFGCICRDITKMKIAEEQLKMSEVQFRKAYYQANFYKELFAHDLANILSIISGSSQLCSFYLNEITNGIHLKENIELIKDQVIRAKNLISNVRKLSMIEESTPLARKIDLIPLLRESVVFVSRSYKERDVSIKIESSYSEYFVQANELLSDIFDNILINAITYTENSYVKITIRLSKKLKDGREFLKLEFIDNGIGIPDNRKKKIFEERQEKEDFVKGMGIGLTLVNTIIKSYNGFIWVENAIQDDYTKGSKFILLIPG